MTGRELYVSIHDWRIVLNALLFLVHDTWPGDWQSIIILNTVV